MSEIQCHAPNNETYIFRCPNKAIGDSLHCQLHNPKAVKLYRKYKKICDKLKNINYETILLSESVKEVTKYYSLLLNEYLGRIAHKNYGFIDECYDDGHRRKITNLSNQINEVESVLFELRKSNDDVNEEPIEIEELSDDSDEIDIIPATITQIVDIPENINTIITEHQNAVITQEDKEKLFFEEKIFKQVDKLTFMFNRQKMDKAITIEQLVICVTNIILKIDDLGGFEKNYKPDRRVMLQNYCDAFIPYSTRNIGEPMVYHYRKSNGTPWDTIMRKYNVALCNIKIYRHRHTLKEIKRIYECLLMNQDIILNQLSCLGMHVVNNKTLTVIQCPCKVLWNPVNECLGLALFKDY